MTNLNRIKYPRTLHIPSSPGATSDDKMLTASQYVEFFQGRNIQITEKMDGENTTLYSDYLHARSLDSRHHPSRDWVKRFQSEIGHNIPDNWRICGENLFAKHSVSYDNLDSYFYGFSIWNENNICLSAEETSTWFTLLGIQHVPVIDSIVAYKKWWEIIENHAKDVINKGGEGVVIRTAQSFHYDKFQEHLAKYVRANHVLSSEHWMSQLIIPNKLKGN